jgi:hypothetical protein|eukprot:COSAG01_NODE_774_length_13702_cov_11.108726_12_plen_157_part_00
MTPVPPHDTEERTHGRGQVRTYFKQELERKDEAHARVLAEAEREAASERQRHEVRACARGQRKSALFCRLKRRRRRPPLRRARAAMGGDDGGAGWTQAATAGACARAYAAMERQKLELVRSHDTKLVGAEQEKLAQRRRHESMLAEMQATQRQERE